MQDKNTQMSGDQHKTSENPHSVSTLKNKIIASQVAAVNLQKTTTQTELENLRKKSDSRLQPTSVDNNVVSGSVNTKKNLAELNGFKLSSMKDKLFSNQSVNASSAQKLRTAEDLKILQAAEGNVRSKAKQLEIFFQQSRLALDALKKNKVSEMAKSKLTQPHEFKIFENQQVVFIEDVRKKLENDIHKFVESPKLQKLGYAKFLELAFVFRSYEVCLEQDYRRHGAEYIKSCMANNTVKLDADGKLKIEQLSGHPSQMAVESLNYYNDFFNNLAAIEEIWPNVGIQVRKSEIKSGFAANVYKDVNMVSILLNDKNSVSYLQSYSAFEDALDHYINNHKNVSDYIGHGNGLDVENHPFKFMGLIRLPQPNVSIDFSKIVVIDSMHADAIHEVESRVEADKKSLFGRVMGAFSY